ncbi:MAG: hypothetical protein M1822_007301 [Bathelium mastoideum]|nr:MAG: hypothetical protein M1822_007301 [Bathelium mastoideum]
MLDDEDQATLEWFGATTFRLRACGLTIFLDTWLERPSLLPSYMRIVDSGPVDYIFISHAHFDHLPGCDRLAKQTGAIVIANGEAIKLLRDAGVSEEQLLPVAGGERIPLFTHAAREAARKGEGPLAAGPPGAPLLPDPSLAVMAVHSAKGKYLAFRKSATFAHVNYSHADIPETMDTATVYEGSSQFACTIDITRGIDGPGMRYGLLRLGEIVPAEHLDSGDKAFIEYSSDRSRNIMSSFDGGQMIFSFQIGGKTLLWNSHLGGYRGILQNLEPRPDVLILAVAGRANFDGKPFDGSAAEAATEVCKWLGEPSQVIFCLHDQALIKPWSIDTKAAKSMIEKNTRSKIRDLDHAIAYRLFSA